jgi:hypothetical protein
MWQTVWQTTMHVLAWLAAWLKNHDWLAIWLEGIALVALFVVEFRQFRKSNKDTLEQLEITKKQAETARLTAQSVMNSERAWLMGDLAWRNDKGNLIFVDNQTPPDQIKTSTHAEFVLTLRNDGRTPAWIETVFTGMGISGMERQPPQMITSYIEPLGAGKQQRVLLKLSCPGKPKMIKSESLVIHITVNYRDIFQDQVMALEFSVDSLTEVIRRFEKVKLDFTS